MASKTFQGPPAQRLQVQNAAIRVVKPQITEQALRDVDHERGIVSGIGHGGFRDVLEVFQILTLFGVPEDELDLKPGAIIVDQPAAGKLQVAT